MLYHGNQRASLPTSVQVEGLIIVTDRLEKRLNRAVREQTLEQTLKTRPRSHRGVTDRGHS
jgi:hypothetical protein